MKDKISWKAAMAIVMANMIGTGVFTSLGFQLLAVTNTWSIVFLWVIGAVMAIAGAFTYAELGTGLKRSGGEYHFLSATFHPFVGYLSGWVSLIVGFAAPVALAAMAAGAYLKTYVQTPPQLIAIGIVILVSFAHTFDLKRSSRFQNLTTYFKVVIMLFFILIGFVVPSAQSGFEWSNSWQQEVLLAPFAVSLVYVSYAYSGWNAAAYITDEIKDVNRNLPIALVGGSLIVSILYITIQLVFLHQVPIELLKGKIEIGQIVAVALFGTVGGQIVSTVIALMLVSSISAMTWVGPRVTQTMATDYALWKVLRHTNKNGIPIRATWFQAFIAGVMIWTGSFDQILVYSGFILQLFVTLTVAGVFLMRKNNHGGEGYRSPFFPLMPIAFLIPSIWILAYLVFNQTTESLIGLLILAIGTITYLINHRYFKKSNHYISVGDVEKPDRGGKGIQ